MSCTLYNTLYIRTQHGQMGSFFRAGLKRDAVAMSKDAQSWAKGHKRRPEDVAGRLRGKAFAGRRDRAALDFRSMIFQTGS